eukprot:10537940-Lingulodinium_polyedra.AAC.1
MPTAACFAGAGRGNSFRQLANSFSRSSVKETGQALAISSLERMIKRPSGCKKKSRDSSTMP